MALQKTLSLLLLLLLTLLGLRLVKLFYGETPYEKFQRQHVDSEESGDTDLYCNTMMEKRGMTSGHCKDFNTFIHENIRTINNICKNPHIRCKRGTMNCHEGVVKVTDCKHTHFKAPYSSDRVIMERYQPPTCNYQAWASTRRVVIACEDNPLVPVHLDS
ncbi:ribonuclease 4-like isoform X1 [Pipistrellus kuhlii]|uniref:ribonuclease 4-like isoform X1 n=1 Tax=Pipistrellus kuhlii TaxID=59472 RepID=UPI00174F68CF|nr:ribonuclease 4-like isoform X1 [Pipistrellus kuhlii]